MGAKSRIQQHPAPVRMGAMVARMDKENSRPHQEPVRIQEKAKVLAVGEPWRLAPRIESRSEQNLHSEVCREEQPVTITEEQARVREVRERLQHLSGSREVTDPIRHQVASLSVHTHTHTPSHLDPSPAHITTLQARLSPESPKYPRHQFLQSPSLPDWPPIHDPYCRLLHLLLLPPGYPPPVRLLLQLLRESGRCPLHPWPWPRNNQLRIRFLLFVEIGTKL